VLRGDIVAYSKISVILRTAFPDSKTIKKTYAPEISTALHSRDSSFTVPKSKNPNSNPNPDHNANPNPNPNPSRVHG